MNRYELEEAVAQAKQLVHTVRGIEGIVKICEASLNATQIVDNLEEQKNTLLAEMEAIKSATEQAASAQELNLAKLKKTHDDTRMQLAGEIKQIAIRRDQLNSEYEKAKRDHSTKLDQLRKEYDEWMLDCQQKQKVANDQLTAITAQIDAILAARAS